MKQGIDLKDAIDALTDLIIGKKTKSNAKKTTSRKKKTGMFFFEENRYVPIIIPIKAPWKDMPPSQTLKVFKGLSM